jgi:hypothetical protein
VMHNNLDPRDAGREEQEPARTTPQQEPMVTDREVPMASAHTPEAIHAWLDGESVSPEQLHAAEKEYSFWQQVEAENGRRRRMHTPSSLPGQIMKAITKEK